MTNGAPPSSTASTAHELTLAIRGTGRFVGACSCGWFTDAMPTAGLVHGAHGSHIAGMATRAG